MAAMVSSVWLHVVALVDEGTAVYLFERKRLYAQYDAVRSRRG